MKRRLIQISQCTSTVFVPTSQGDLLFKGIRVLTTACWAGWSYFSSLLLHMLSTSRDCCARRDSVFSAGGGGLWEALPALRCMTTAPLHCAASFAKSRFAARPKSSGACRAPCYPAVSCRGVVISLSVLLSTACCRPTAALACLTYFLL